MRIGFYNVAKSVTLLKSTFFWPTKVWYICQRLKWQKLFEQESAKKISQEVRQGPAGNIIKCCLVGDW